MNPFPLNHALHSLDEFCRFINPAEAAAVHRATYFTLQACNEWGDHVVLASIEDAEDAGDFRIHVGLPDRPDMRSVFTCQELADAVKVLTALRVLNPDAPLWLSTIEIQIEMKGVDVWPALVAARASSDQSNACCPWVQLDADFTAGQITRKSYGDSGSKHWLHATVANQIGSL
jgi:hypothetical protein